jgi:hypothetical protein
LTAALSSAVAYRTWTASEDPATVLSFVQAHLPPGSTISGSGSGGPAFTQSVTRSWPVLHRILDSRLLLIEVTERAGGGTRLYVEAQSQWVVTRPRGERIPGGVREVDITDGWPGQPPFLSRRVTSAADVQKLVGVFNSLGIAQPVGVSCPSESVVPVVTVSFRTGETGVAVAQATVDSSANLPWPASAPGWNCFSIAFTVRGRTWNRLVGNVIAPIQHVLHVKLARQGPPPPSRVPRAPG